MNRLRDGGVKLFKPKLTRWRIVLAFAVTIVADILQFPIVAATATGLLAVPGEAADMIVDTIVMILVSALVGFHWSFLPSFVMEAVPLLDVIPTWTGCVAYVVWRRRREERQSGQE